MPRLNRKKALGLLLLLEYGEGIENRQDQEEGPNASGSGEEQEQHTRQARRRIWVREELQKRGQLGEFSTMFAEERLNAGAFHAAYRMTPTRFEELLSLVGHRLQRQATTFRIPIPPAERLALNVR